jgi:hypothetical protein
VNRPPKQITFRICLSTAFEASGVDELHSQRELLVDDVGDALFSDLPQLALKEFGIGHWADGIRQFLDKKKPHGRDFPRSFSRTAPQIFPGTTTILGSCLISTRISPFSPLVRS